MEMVHGNRVDYCGSERADIHLGHGVPVRPNTLKQTAQEIKKQLANRAGHTFPLRADPAFPPRIDPPLGIVRVVGRGQVPAFLL